VEFAAINIMAAPRPMRTPPSSDSEDTVDTATTVENKTLESA
jgi:hypothetical protein